MKANLLNNYVLKLRKSFEKNLSAYMTDKKPECLHHLRVDIKKIKAVFSFADNIYKEKHDVTKLKPLFLKAGKIREMHINIKLLCAIPPPPEKFINRLKNKENIIVQRFIKNGSRYIMLLKNFYEKAGFPEKLGSKRKIIEYFKKERKKANKILRHKDRESMHRYRKKIKKLLFIYNALPKKVQNKIELDVGKINKQQKKLGEWHDTYSAINYFSHEHYPNLAAEYILKFQEKENEQFNALLINLANNSNA